MLHQVNIFVHVLAGIVGIFIAIVPYVSKKGGTVHRKYGRVFLWLMAIVIITALNGVLIFVDRPFLTVVTLLSFYSAYSGFRVLKTKEKGFEWIDFAVMVLVLAVAFGFLFGMSNANVLWHSSVVYYMLGYVIALVGFDALRFFWPKLISNPKFWLYEHIYKITGAFGALISAGAGTVFAAFEPYNQILPASFTTLWLVFCLIYFPRKNRALFKVPNAVSQ